MDRDSFGWVTPLGLWQHPEVKPLSEYRDDGVVVVLGERGVGKSQVLLMEHEALRAAGASSSHVALPDVSSHRMKQSITESLAAAIEGTHYAFVDGLDDTTNPTETAALIAESLEDLTESGRANLRLRLACRGSRWPASLERRLAEMQPHSLRIIGVAGLTRGQALAAAAQRGLANPEQFVSELESRRLVVPVAMWPITYIPALEDSAVGKQLPRTVREAYDRACMWLCTETATEASSGSSPRLDPREVLALARKAAAAMQFSAHNVLSEAIGDEDAISLDDLAQDSEPFGDRRVACTHRGFQQLTQSSMLVQTGREKRWAFAHRSFQEYLAAEYLLTHNAAQPSVERLLLIGEGVLSRAVQAHRDVAAWVATTNDVLFERLLAQDPTVLLHADLRSRGDSDRVRVFERLLDMVRDGDRPVDDPSLLASLDGPSIVSRIAPMLHASTPLEELYLALQVANECPHQDFTEALLGVAEAVGIPKSLRTRALHALNRVDQPEWLARLRALARDQDPDVAAGALRKLWPSHMSTIDLLQSLPTPVPDYIGMAVYFLRRLAEAIPAQDLPAAVQWAVQVFTEDDMSPGLSAAGGRGRTAEEIAIRAVRECLEHPDAASLLDGMADLCLALTNQDVHGIAWDLQRTLRENPTARRSIARAALNRATADQVLHLHGQNPVCLFSIPDDALHWARELPNLPSQLQALFPEQPWMLSEVLPQWEVVYELAQAHPIVNRVTRSLFEWPVDHWVGQRHRALEASNARREAERALTRFDPAKLRAALDSVLDGEDTRLGWRDVIRHIHRTTDGDIEPFGERLGITTAPNFPPPGSADLERMLRAARTVLESAAVITVSDVGPAGLHLFGQVPELLALSLCVELHEPLPELEPARWTGLAIALFCIHEHDLEPAVRTSLLRTCADYAAGGFEAMLPDVLTRLGDNWRAIAVRTLDASPGQAAEEALLGWAVSRGRTIEQWAQILDALVDWRHQEAIDALRKAASTPAARLLDTKSPAARRWTAAANILVRRACSEAWPTIFRRLNRMPHLAPGLMRSFAEYDGPDFWRTDPGVQTTEALAELYGILVEYGPGEEVLARPDHNNNEINLVRLRQSLPRTIARQADGAALATLEDLERRQKGDYSLRAELLKVQHQLVQMAWKPLRDVREVVTVTTHRTERVVTSEHHLRDVVLESLGRLQERICDDNGWASILWDLKYTSVIVKKKRRSRIEWKPKREQDFNDFVATFLRYDLEDRRVIVNREVEITRTGLPGDRTDIQVHAHLPEGAGPGTLTVIVESKGCWNSRLDTELSSQLVDRYLCRQGLRAGIYLIGYFDDHRWEGRKDHVSHGIDEIRDSQERLAQQAASDHGVSVKVCVLDCRLQGHHPELVPELIP